MDGVMFVAKCGTTKALLQPATVALGQWPQFSSTRNPSLQPETLPPFLH